jgi:dodecin
MIPIDTVHAKLLPCRKIIVGGTMPEGRVARVTEIIAGSPKSFDDAIMVGFRRATKTLRGITGIKVKDMRAKVEEGKITEYRVTLDVLFILEN